MDYTKTIQGLALPKSVPDTSPYRSNSGEPLVQGGGRRSPLPKDMATSALFSGVSGDKLFRAFENQG